MKFSWTHIQKALTPYRTTLFVVGVSLIYWATRLFMLDSFPVFADEAIYIRWAQLISHDSKYLFFSLNDGKPPLFMWLLLPLFSVLQNPVIAGRFLSAAAGFLQLWVSDAAVKTFGGGWKARTASATLITVLPFWFFQHRLAVMDALLTLFLSLSWLGLVWLSRSLKKPTFWSNKDLVFAILTAGVAWGAALWTKTPALFMAPIFVGAAYIFPWLDSHVSLTEYVKKNLNFSWLSHRTIAFALAGSLGTAIFLLMKLHPAFGSLFGRSSDFTYALSDLLTQGPLIVWNNLNRVIPWIATYVRPELFSFTLIAALVSSQRRHHWWILASGIVWIAPLILLGKTLHPRYFLPITFFITLSGALFWEEVWNFLQRTKQDFVQWLVFLSLSTFLIIGSLRFMLLHQLDTARTPFVLHDREQYLTDWSSGYGIKEVRDKVLATVRDGQRVTVVTEGSFGTLPDGLLLYFDQLPEIEHVRIEGLAQYPVKTLPEWVLQDAQKHPTWLVVNEHRLQLESEYTDNVQELERYTRPYGAPPLLLLEILPESASEENTEAETETQDHTLE